MRLAVLLMSALAGSALLTLPTFAAAPARAAEGATRGREPAVSLCDLVEEALLATAPKPTPAVEYQERQERRRNIERIRRQVQQLRDAGRCP